LASGEPRELKYFVELKNKPGLSGRSAGLSNAAVVLGGASPPGVKGLTATVRADGVALHWNTDRGAETAVRLHRKLVAAVGVSGLPLNNGSEKGKSASRPPSPEPVVRDLFVAFPEGHNSTGALDNTARFGETYAYSAQRLLQLQVDGRTLELDGPISPTIQVDVIDTFPPTVPSGLVAVAVSEPDSRPAIEAIDLSWLPDTESDLAGYIVYRSETQDGRSENWVRVSGAKPVEEPAFHDTKVRAGRTYRYAVSAIDLTGHESKKSVETEESVPEP